MTQNEEKNELLVHAVINQLETDFDEQEFDAMDEFLATLLKNPDNRDILYNYLSDTSQKNFNENLTNKRY